VTAAEQVTSRRLQYCRTIVRNLARQRFNDPNWRLDEATADSMKRLVRRMLGNSDAPVRRSRTRKPEIEIQMRAEGYCTAHMERTGERRPVYKECLCYSCFDGEAIRQSENYGEGAKVPEFGIPQKLEPRTESLAYTLVELEAAAQFGKRDAKLHSRDSCTREIGLPLSE
jgi:hypothetical protein